MRDAARARSTTLALLPSLDSRVRPPLTLVVLAVAMLLGGSAVPALVLVVELVALPLLVLVVALPPPMDRMSRAAGWLCAAAALVVAMQLVPLPTTLSTALPGRELATAIRTAAGLAGPFSLSLDPQATLASGLALVPSVAILLSALRASSSELARLVALAVTIGIASALLGVYQVATGAPYFFSYAHVGQSTGLFANRNHQGALILSVMLLAAGLGRGWATTLRRRLLVATLVVVLAPCAVLTTSRATLLLLPFALGVALAVLFVRRRIAPWRVGGTVVAGLALLGLVSQMAVVAPVVDRLSSVGSDGRFGYWEDADVALRAMWPVGSGFGTFPAVYATVENLDAVERSRVDHAHNEVLELLLEGGAAAAALLLAWLALVAAATARRFRSVDAPGGIAALAAVIVIAAVSLTEFPLRNFAVAVVFAVAHAVLLHPGTARAGQTY